MEDKSIVLQSNNNEKTTRQPLAGFNVHPENINREGRPLKGQSLTDALKQRLEEDPNLKNAIISKAIEMALNGNEQAMKLVWNYLDGMPLSKTELTGAGGKNLFPAGELTEEKKEEIHSIITEQLAIMRENGKPTTEQPQPDPTNQS